MPSQQEESHLLSPALPLCCSLFEFALPSSLLDPGAVLSRRPPPLPPPPRQCLYRHRPPGLNLQPRPLATASRRASSHAFHPLCLRPHIRDLRALPLSASQPPSVPCSPSHPHRCPSLREPGGQLWTMNHRGFCCFCFAAPVSCYTPQAQREWKARG